MFDWLVENFTNNISSSSKKKLSDNSAITNSIDREITLICSLIH